MPYDPERHHRRSVRLRAHDYAGGGAYFVTICEINRACVFGDVIDGRMILSEAGEIAREEWFRSQDLRASVQIAAGIVMPNHLHGVVLIDPDENGLDGRMDSSPEPPPGDRRLIRPAASLGSMIAQYKATAARRINALRGTPGVGVWQRNYYEHVIRSDSAMAHIVNYILTNPLRWHLDTDNPYRLSADDFDLWLGEIDEARHSGPPSPPS